MLILRKRAPALDRAGRTRRPVTVAGFQRGQEPRNKGRKFPAEPLTPEEVYRLINACRGRAAVRNQALIVMLWRCGLRISEALALYPKDVDLEHGRVAVLHGKGDKRRVVPIDYGAARIVELWEKQREQLGLGGSDAYFCVLQGPTKGLPLQPAYPRNVFKELAKRAGIQKRVHPHGLRHTYAAYLLERGVPLHYIRRALGHTSIAVTERYADHINPAEVVEALRVLDWPV